MTLEGLNKRIVACTKCPRLVTHRESVSQEKRKAYREWNYWGRPVPGFGDPQARILAVGLAPGAHGSNRTGRQFTGDASGRFLFPALFRAGLASQPESVSRDDGLRLRGLYISAACRCVPPGNRPTPLEISNCRPYLKREIDLLDPRVIVCLGRIAFDDVVRLHSLRPADFAFRHGSSYRLADDSRPNDRCIICSYHPSQQNTLTGRLTRSMFDRIWMRARTLAGYEEIQSPG